MFLQMVRTSEPFVAELTDERFFAGMRAMVSDQFIGTRELPWTALPHAVEGSLSGVAPTVRLQMRSTAIDLAAALRGAAVHRVPRKNDGRAGRFTVLLHRHRPRRILRPSTAFVSFDVFAQRRRGAGRRTFSTPGVAGKFLVL